MIGLKIFGCVCLFISLSLGFDESVFQFEQPKAEGKHWALLVAGSNGYMNYRHQADVCHAYQILKSHGIPDENIIVMMYDDIAENKENPVKGNIINQPEGPNVYEGVPKDYTGRDVNPEKFLAVLTGDKDKAGGRVIESGPDDHVFLNFVDHGAPGLLAFGEDTVRYSGPNDHVFLNFVDHGAPGILGFGTKRLKASQLNDAIMDMYKKQKYSKMVVYIEACESGSMFYDMLPKDINVFATTASNAHESSYACYFDKTRRTYLGDVYSIKWMQDSDKHDLNSETLKKQFEITKQEVNTSHVQEFGDKSIGNMDVGEFQGTEQAVNVPPKPKDPCADAVKSEDVPVEILRRSIPLAETEEEKEELEQRLKDVLQDRLRVEVTVQKIAHLAAGDNQLASNIINTKKHYIKQWQCYESVVDYLEIKCPKTLNLPQNDYALRHLYMFVNMCEENISQDRIMSAIDKVCAEF